MQCNTYYYINYRPKWIIKSGIKYQKPDYVIMGWQEDDLPIFGQIQDIMVTDHDEVFFELMAYDTLGIHRHYHSFVIQKSLHEAAILSISELGYHETFYAHRLINDSLYITLRSHIEKLT